MKTRITLLFLLFTSAAFSQADTSSAEEKREKVPEMRMNIKGEFKLPTPLYNTAFTKTVNGIGDISLHFNYPVFRFGSVGAGFKFLYMQINDFKTNVKTNASVKGYIPFLRLGFEKFTRPKFAYGFHVKAGYSLLHFYSNQCDSINADYKGIDDKGFFIEPEISFHLLSTDNLSFGAYFGYNLIFDEYGPDNICLPNFSGLSASDSKGIYQFISVGFGFSAFISKEKAKRGRETIYW